MASPTKEIQKAAYSIADPGKNNAGTDKSKTSGRLFFPDAGGGRVFFITDLAGSVYNANLDGSNKKTLLVGEGKIKLRAQQGKALDVEAHA